MQEQNNPFLSLKYRGIQMLGKNEEKKYTVIAANGPAEWHYGRTSIFLVDKTDTYITEEGLNTEKFFPLFQIDELLYDYTNVLIHPGFFPLMVLDLIDSNPSNFEYHPKINNGNIFDKTLRNIVWEYPLKDNFKRIKIEQKMRGINEYQTEIDQVKYCIGQLKETDFVDCDGEELSINEKGRLMLRNAKHELQSAEKNNNHIGFNWSYVDDPFIDIRGMTPEQSPTEIFDYDLKCSNLQQPSVLEAALSALIASDADEIKTYSKLSSIEY